MNEKLQYKIRSQYGLILKELGLNPGKYFTIGYFCGAQEHCFVGYKASARIAELQKIGLLISRWSDRRTSLGTKVKEYRLAPRFTIEFDGDKIIPYECNIPENGQAALFNINRISQ